MDQKETHNHRNWLLILGAIIFTIALSWLLVRYVLIGTKRQMATLEILAFVVTPLTIFYGRSGWPQKTWLINMVVLLFVWFFTDTMFHEMSHMLGAILVGARIVNYRLLPRFWEGDLDFTRGRVRFEFFSDWQHVLPSLSPYLRDIILLAAGLFILKSKKITHSFLAGLIFVFFCLSPLLDILDNYFIRYTIGHSFRNDFRVVAVMIGGTWTNIIGILFTSFAIYVVCRTIFIYKDFPNEEVVR
ncbi:MAG: hypothetical protein ABSA44_02320 [Bacteroidota bacterium]|jgi:hypothetical protein